jgi:hypothetical protein
VRDIAPHGVGAMRWKVHLQHAMLLRTFTRGGNKAEGWESREVRYVPIPRFYVSTSFRSTLLSRLLSI